MRDYGGCSPHAKANCFPLFPSERTTQRLRQCTSTTVVPTVSLYLSSFTLSPSNLHLVRHASCHLHTVHTSFFCLPFILLSPPLPLSVLLCPRPSFRFPFLSFPLLSLLPVSPTSLSLSSSTHHITSRDPKVESGGCHHHYQWNTS